MGGTLQSSIERAHDGCLSFHRGCWPFCVSLLVDSQIGCGCLIHAEMETERFGEANCGSVTRRFGEG